MAVWWLVVSQIIVAKSNKIWLYLSVLKSIVSEMFLTYFFAYFNAYFVCSGSVEAHIGWGEVRTWLIIWLPVVSGIFFPKIITTCSSVFKLRLIMSVFFFETQCSVTNSAGDTYYSSWGSKFCGRETPKIFCNICLRTSYIFMKPQPQWSNNDIKQWCMHEADCWVLNPTELKQRLEQY